MNITNEYFCNYFTTNYQHLPTFLIWSESHMMLSWYHTVF